MSSPSFPPPPPTCYVCETTDRALGPVYRVCSCDNYIHEGCFEGVVTTVPAHSKRCAVCHHEYATEWTCDVASTLRSVVWCWMSFGWCAFFLYSIERDTSIPLIVLMAMVNSWILTMASREMRGIRVERVASARRQLRDKGASV